MAKDVIEKILDCEKAAESVLADAKAEAEKIVADAKAEAEKIIADAKRGATDEVNKNLLEAENGSAELVKNYSSKADAEIEKIKAEAKAKESEALKALTELIIK